MPRLNPAAKSRQPLTPEQQQLVIAHQKLALKLCNDFLRRHARKLNSCGFHQPVRRDGVLWQEAVSVAYEALVRTAQYYDASRGYSFGASLGRIVNRFLNEMSMRTRQHEQRFRRESEFRKASNDDMGLDGLTTQHEQPFVCDAGDLLEAIVDEEGLLARRIAQRVAYSDLSYDEIAAELGVAPNRVRITMMRMRENDRLRERLTEMCEL